MLDWRVCGARIIDGVGAPWFRGDVGIRDGCIVAVGKLEGARRTRELEAGDRCPGVF
jgi:N-acyl-D-amino-acid deacylase